MPRPDLKAVTSELPDPPYPANTKSGSFPFDLEMDRVVASDTWALLAADMRPWAHMSWSISWLQVPCGSFPNNDDVISARLGIDRRLFQMNRNEILRGWIPHSDNRLYHPFITSKVLSMIESREKWRTKKSSQRNQQVNENVSGDTPESPQGVPRVSRSSCSSSSSCSPKTTKDFRLGAPNKKKRFQKPTPEELSAYCREKGFEQNGLSCIQDFLDYYEANGWRVGKNPMASWPHAFSKWVRTNETHQRNSPKRGNSAADNAQAMWEFCKQHADDPEPGNV